MSCSHRREANRRQVVAAIPLAALALSCGPSLERSAADYRQRRSAVSLETVVKSLRKGMKRAEVERLLGAPDYSPIEGQFYYSSGRPGHGLVIDYRRDGQVTGQLQEFALGPIGE